MKPQPSILEPRGDTEILATYRGLGREVAHPFYRREGMEKTCFHFAAPV